METTEKISAKELGRRIKTMRESLDWSQSVLAEKADLTDGAIKMIETGKRWPRAKTLGKILSALGVHSFDVYDNGSISYAPPAPKILTAEDIIRLTHPETADEMELLRLFRSASPALKESVLETVRHLLNPGHNK